MKLQITVETGLLFKVSLQKFQSVKTWTDSSRLFSFSRPSHAVISQSEAAKGTSVTFITRLLNYHHTIIWVDLCSLTASARLRYEPAPPALATSHILLLFLINYQQGTQLSRSRCTIFSSDTVRVSKLRERLNAPLRVEKCTILPVENTRKCLACNSTD